MSWPLREITIEERDAMNWTEVPTGACWRIPLDRDLFGTRYGDLYRDLLSPQFRASGRDYVIVVRLPCGSEWTVDFKFYEKQDGWVVTGELPAITARPSVDQHNRYHGWLTDGVLSDDLEGRRYP